MRDGCARSLRALDHARLAIATRRRRWRRQCPRRGHRSIMLGFVRGRSGCSTKQRVAARLRSNQKMEETMDIDRRQLILPALALGLLSVVPVGTVPAFAASEDEEAVAKSVEAFRAAQFAANAEALASLCAAELSYSHSDGRVEDKATFIANATSGKSKFLSLEYQDTKIRVVGPAAIVRFHWMGEQEAVADGKKSSTNLHILMNWQKQAADWKLLSRASTKL
jgi:ketosteroid isomerase-like protein